MRYVIQGQCCIAIRLIKKVFLPQAISWTTFYARFYTKACFPMSLDSLCVLAFKAFSLGKHVSKDFALIAH